MEEEKEILYFKLINGDEIISESILDYSWTLINPTQLKHMSSNEGFSIVLVNYIPFSESNEIVNLKHDRILFVTKVLPEMEEYYKVTVKYLNTFGNLDNKERIKGGIIGVNDYIKERLMNN